MLRRMEHHVGHLAIRWVKAHPLCQQCFGLVRAAVQEHLTMGLLEGLAAALMTRHAFAQLLFLLELLSDMGIDASFWRNSNEDFWIDWRSRWMAARIIWVLWKWRNCPSRLASAASRASRSAAERELR